MKSNILKVSALAFLAIGVLGGCKKGSEDPFISLKSRDARITGTWTLNSIESVDGETNHTITSNDVNSQVIDNNTSETSTYSFDGTSWSETVVSTEKYTKTFMQYNDPVTPTSFVDVTETKDFTTTETTKGTMTITISLYKDNTYEYSETTSTTSFAFKGTGTAKAADNKTQTYEESTGNADFTSTIVDVVTETSTGTWNWDDDTKKSKIRISAGPLSGLLVKLTNKEMIIDGSFNNGVTFDVNGLTPEGTMATDNGNDETINPANNYSTYSNADVYATDNGLETVKASWTGTDTPGTMTFEKTDKASKRD